MTLTNLFATWNKGAGSNVILAAHYDTRHKGDQDWNESRRESRLMAPMMVPVVLQFYSKWLASSYPKLTHEVTLFFTDGEDQGDNH